MMAIGDVMDTNDIIRQIDTEISNLQRARAIPIGVAPAKEGLGHPELTEPKVIKPKKGKLSAKGRAAIPATMKARWAAKKEAASPKIKKVVKGAKASIRWIHRLRSHNTNAIKRSCQPSDLFLRYRP
jgi:hypothetical protein